MWIWIRRPNFSLKCTKSYNCKNNFSRREWCSLFWHYFLLNFLLIFFVLAFCYFLFAFYKIHFAWVFLCKVFPHSGKNCIFVHIFYSFFNFKFYPSLQKSINMLVIRKRLFRFYFEKIIYVNNEPFPLWWNIPRLPVTLPVSLHQPPLKKDKTQSQTPVLN